MHAAKQVQRSAETQSAQKDTLALERAVWLSPAGSDARVDAFEDYLGACEASCLERSTDTFMMLLTDPDRRVREDTVDSLTDIGGGAAIALLELALNDPDPTVRLAAEDGLYELKQSRR